MLATEFSFDYASFFLDERLSEYSSYRVLFRYRILDSLTVPVDILTFFRPYVSLGILQSVSDYHCKFTFVTKMNVGMFEKVISRVSKLIIRKYGITNSEFFYEF